MLADPKHLFGVQNVTPLIYRSALSATGRAGLSAVSAKLTTADLLHMNVRILVDKSLPPYCRNPEFGDCKIVWWPGFSSTGVRLSRFVRQDLH